MFCVAWNMILQKNVALNCIKSNGFSLIFRHVWFLYLSGNQPNGVPDHFGLTLNRANGGAKTRDKRGVTVCRVVGTGPCKANHHCCSGFCGKNEKCQTASPTDTATEESRIQRRRDGERCTADPQCRSRCCNPDTMKCGKKKHLCMEDVEKQKKKNGASCRLDRECESGCCGPPEYTCKHKKYMCIKDDKKKNGARCRLDSECKSGCCGPPEYTCKDKKYMCVKDQVGKGWKILGDWCTAHGQCVSNCCVRTCGWSTCTNKCSNTYLC